MFIFSKTIKIKLKKEELDVYTEEIIYTFFYFIKISYTKESMAIADLNKLYKKTIKIKGFNEITCT